MSENQKPVLFVESPAKERTIGKLLGGRILVAASFGHVRDLPLRSLGVDLKTFEPEYRLLPRAKAQLARWKKLARSAPKVFMGTDFDREGEAIAWHLKELLELPDSKLARITFHEITREALEHALAHPRSILRKLVDAQQARRVLDRLVGYRLSPLLWRKVKRGLSAGRVQSVALRMVAEREKERENFSVRRYFRIYADLAPKGSGDTFRAQVVRVDGEKTERTEKLQLFAGPYEVRSTIWTDSASAEAAARELAGAHPKVARLERKSVSRRPPPPFLTSSLQQESSRKLGFSPARTMRAAQALYEGISLGKGPPVGLITYMRTDSVHVAPPARAAAARFIREKFGADFLPPAPRVYKTRAARAEEAHEAIRPTEVARDPASIAKFLEPDLQKLYELIWRRFLASQMADAVYDSVSVGIEAGRFSLSASGRTLKFRGFLAVYEEAAEEQELAPNLPVLNEGQDLQVEKTEVIASETSPPPRYNEASLIAALEEHGIGRPSTYAPTVETLLERAYVSKESARLVPTPLGRAVSEFLSRNFPEVMDLKFTAQVENRLDEVAAGRIEFPQAVREFWIPLEKKLASASAPSPRVRVEAKKLEERCLLCGAHLLERSSRFGKFWSCEKFPNCRFKVSLGRDGLPQWPVRTDGKCENCGKPMWRKPGRRGRDYLACEDYPKCKTVKPLPAPAAS